MRRGRGVESRYHREVKGWSCGTMPKIEKRQKVDRQNGSIGWRMESKVVRQGEREDRGRRRKASGKGGERRLRMQSKSSGQGDQDKECWIGGPLKSIRRSQWSGRVLANNTNLFVL